MLQWKKRLVMAEVPFAENGGCVALLFEQLEVGGWSSVLLPEGLILVDAGGQRATTAEHCMSAGVAIRSRAIGCRNRMPWFARASIAGV